MPNSGERFLSFGVLVFNKSQHNVVHILAILLIFFSFLGFLGREFLQARILPSSASHLYMNTDNHLCNWREL